MPAVGHGSPMTTVMSDTEADAFVASWMEAWNAHDVERIVAHYERLYEQLIHDLAGRAPCGS